MLQRQTSARHWPQKKGASRHFCIMCDTSRMLMLCAKFLSGEMWITELCEVRLSELWGGHKHTERTHLDFVRVSPVLFKYTFYCHVAREDHHVVVTLSACQLTLLTCVYMRNRKQLKYSTHKPKPKTKSHIRTPSLLKDYNIVQYSKLKRQELKQSIPDSMRNQTKQPKFHRDPLRTNWNDSTNWKRMSNEYNEE